MGELFGFGLTAQVRVLPGRPGEWRVERPSGLHATCASQAEAEREAKELLAGAHGGEVVIYDSRWRVHAVKRFGGRLGLE